MRYWTLPYGYGCGWVGQMIYIACCIDSRTSKAYGVQYLYRKPSKNRTHNDFPPLMVERVTDTTTKFSERKKKCGLLYNKRTCTSECKCSLCLCSRCTRENTRTRRCTDYYVLITKAKRERATPRIGICK